jgi:hypothetical protein
MHCWFAAQPRLQFGEGSVFGTHAPFSQTSFAAQLEVPRPPVHAGAHEPFTHFGVEPLHCVSEVHCVPVVGSQMPFVHCVPEGHDWPLLQSVRHSPSAQTFPAPHSLEYVHAFVLSTHLAHEPEPTHTWPFVQSAFVLQMRGLPGLVPGALHKPFVQTSPCGQSVSALQIGWHPVLVQIWFCWQSPVPEHFVGVGEGTAWQP